MPFNDYEQSIQDSAPVELYTFTTPTTTYRLTSYHKDITFGGNTFTATPASRSSIHVVDLHNDHYDATVELPASHALIQSYANGVPPSTVSCLIQRYQPASGLAIQMWFGYVVALNFKGRMGSLRIPSGLADALMMDCPSVLAQRLCNHILYDTRCGEDPDNFKVLTTVAAISGDGRTITTVDPVPAAINNVNWAEHGIMFNVAANEYRTIVGQPGNSLTQFAIQCEYPVGSIAIGNAIRIYAGCDHRVSTCRDKFDNVLKFGGHPDLPSSNIFYVGLLNAKFGV